MTPDSENKSSDTFVCFKLQEKQVQEKQIFQLVEPYYPTNQLGICLKAKKTILSNNNLTEENLTIISMD